MPRPGCSAVHSVMVVNIYMLTVSNIFYNMVSFTVSPGGRPLPPAVHSILAGNPSFLLKSGCSGLCINSPVFSYYMLTPFFRRSDVLTLFICRPSVQTFFILRTREQRRPAEACAVTPACPVGTDFRFAAASKFSSGSITRLFSADRTVYARGLAPAYTTAQTFG